MGRSQVADEFDAAGSIRRDEPRIIQEDILKAALAQRPDLMLARGAQARNQADLRLQMAQGKVDYTAGTEYRRQQGINGTGNSLGVYFSAPLPVWNRNQGEIARAQREIAQADTQVRAAEARVRGEVVSAWQQYSMSLGILRDIEQRMLSTSREVLQATEYSYRRGEATLVEFLDAQRAFSEVTQSYNEAWAAYAKGLYLIDSVAANSVSGAAGGN
jgi:cobalt-zinc-cadmium efflux system outer membrane protein